MLGVNFVVPQMVRLPIGSINAVTQGWSMNDNDLLTSSQFMPFCTIIGNSCRLPCSMCCHQNCVFVMTPHSGHVKLVLLMATTIKIMHIFVE